MSMKRISVYGRKIKYITSLIVPLIYGAMYVPVWHGNELVICNIISLLFLIIQAICFVLAIINLHGIFRGKKILSPVICNFAMLISVTLFCFAGIFFVEQLAGAPVFPPQN